MKIFIYSTTLFVLSAPGGDALLKTTIHVLNRKQEFMFPSEVYVEPPPRVFPSCMQRQESSIWAVSRS